MQIKKINSGISIEGFKYKKIKVKIKKTNNSESILIFKLKEGKNREIRNICNYFNWSIIKLKRLQFGPIKLNKEKPGEIKKIYTIPSEFLC